jgi:hypothetical protein
MNPVSVRRVEIFQLDMSNVLRHRAATAESSDPAPQPLIDGASNVAGVRLGRATWCLGRELRHRRRRRRGRAAVWGGTGGFLFWGLKAAYRFV